jgi:hypothetical protein
MFVGIIFILLGIFIVYLLLDFLLKFSADLNPFLLKWITKTLWIWLPIAALPRLIREVIFKKK